MINARNGAALALALSALAMAVGIAALAISLRDDGPGAGRLVETHLQPFTGDPVLFYLDDFYLSAGTDGRLRALYLYPASHFGRMRGCKVVWVRDEVVRASGSSFGPGLFVDPCGGARFDRDGSAIQGPAERGLDYFRTQPGFQGIIVDTSTLYCGSPSDLSAPGTVATGTPASRASSTPAADAGGGNVKACERASRDTGQ